MQCSQASRRISGLVFTLVVVTSASVVSPPLAQSETPTPLQIEVSTAVTGAPAWDWTQARTAFIPGPDGFAITTMSRTARTGAHGFHDVYYSVSRDHGESWTAPTLIPTLRRTRSSDGFEVAAGDLWPMFHPKTGKVLITGKTFNFADGVDEDHHREQVAYVVYDPVTDRFGPLQILKMPAHDHQGHSILAPNAGCNQPVYLPNGEVLAPIRFLTDRKHRVYTTVVARCRFDGETLQYLEHGSEHTEAIPRGLYEPSLTEFRGQFLLTMRGENTGYVASGSDGLHFDEQREWTFDDGSPLQSYNTQQHWATVAGRLYLIYTRRGANNDHVFRHRAPLFIAQVDPDRLCVLRNTEQIVFADEGATLGNSGVCRISDQETWITCGESRVALGPRSDATNRVLLARIVGE